VVEESSNGSLQEQSPLASTPINAPVAPRPKRRLAFIGGGLQIFFILLFAMYNGFYYEGSEYKARVLLFSLPHVVLFLFCVLSKKFWMAFATAVACGLTLIVDVAFLWYFWSAPQSQADLWQLSLWLLLKVLPSLCLFFLFLWMRSLDRLKRSGVADHVKIH
jgi:hypothetical protein